MQTMLMRGALIVLGLLVATFATAQERPKIVAVNYPLQYFAERLLGDAADVVFPVPADVDPSFWRPSIADISMIQSADLILLNGAAFATWIDRVSLPRSRLVNTSAALEDRFIAIESITHSHGEGREHSHEGLASYIWLDPTLAIAQAEAIAKAATERALAPPDDITAKLDTLRAELLGLDQTTQSLLAGGTNVILIATHPRYQYFGRRYGLEIASLEWEAGAAPNSEQLAELLDLKQQTGAEVLIWEADPPMAALRAVEELGMQNVVFPPLAHKPEGADFVNSYEDSVLALSTALAK